MAGLGAVFRGAVGRRRARRPGHHPPPDEEDEAASNLNRRAHALVGQTFTLEAPIVDGSGRIRVGDSSWRVTGPSAPAGASVRVVRVEGATLVVETV